MKEGSRATASMRGNLPSCCDRTCSGRSMPQKHGVRTLKELARSYLAISKDLGRVMSGVKAIYTSWGIPCAGKQVYAPRYGWE